MQFTITTMPTAPSLKHLEAVLLPVWLDSKPESASTARGKARKGFVFGSLFKLLEPVDQQLITNYLASREVKSGEIKLLRLNHAPGYALIAVENEFTEKKFSLLVRRFIRTAKGEGFHVVGVYADDIDGSAVLTTSGSVGSLLGRTTMSAQRAGELIAEHSLLAHYDFSEVYKTEPKEGWKRISTLVVMTQHDKAGIVAAIKKGEVIAESVNHCRTLANYPPSDLKPEGMAEAARTIASSVKGVTVTVFDEKKLKQQGMNAILAVGQGSASAPRLIIMEYSGGKKGDKPLALVGKGVTFDSGGLNLKPGEHMADMHMDMSGGAAVIYAVETIAKLKLPVNVIGLVPAVENMPSGLSYRQGDIIKAYGGKTIEIGNTDAEGRVILADAIEYAKTKKPILIAEISTLTGAAEVALGQRAAALFVKNNKPLQDALQALGDASGDIIWPLPLWEEHEKDVEGNLADVINTHKHGSRWGGAITGAAFLSKFAAETPFAHIDMAPRMLTLPEEEYLSRGASGFGVRLLVSLATEWERIRKLV